MIDRRAKLGDDINLMKAGELELMENASKKINDKLKNMQAQADRIK